MLQFSNAIAILADLIKKKRQSFTKSVNKKTTNRPYLHHNIKTIVMLPGVCIIFVTDKNKTQS